MYYYPFETDCTLKGIDINWIFIDFV